MAARKPKTDPAALPADNTPAGTDQVEHDQVELDRGHGQAQRDQPGVRAILVRARCDGFRRAGRQFGREAVEIDLGALSGGELAALLAEPLLEVAFVPDGQED